MHINSINILVDVPYTARDHARFGFDIFKGSGYKTKVWDISLISNPNYQPDALRNDGDSENLFVPQTKSRLIEQLFKLGPNDVVIFLLAYNLRNLWLYQRISRLNLLSINCKLGSLLFVSKPSYKRSFFKKILPLLTNPLPRLDVLMRKIPPNILGVKSIDFTIVDGEINVAPLPPVGHNSKLIYAHSFDYDRALEITEKPKASFDNYFVYVDEGIVHHPDYLYQKIKSPVSAAWYFSNLSRFLDRFEETYGGKVLIAGHPRTDRRKVSSEVFGNREIIFDDTCRLVRDSLGVITHASTAINFAVIFEKPIIFLNSTKFPRSSPLFYGPEANAHFFKSKTVMFDEPTELPPNLLDMRRERYLEYKALIIKKEGSPNKATWEILCDVIKSL